MLLASAAQGMRPRGSLSLAPFALAGAAVWLVRASRTPAASDRQLLGSFWWSAPLPALPPEVLAVRGEKSNPGRKQPSRTET